jgi:hypothetical protein
LHIKLEVIFLSIRTYSIIGLKLLIVLVQFELAARTSLGLNRSGELCAFIASEKLRLRRALMGGDAPQKMKSN